ncbi:MAG: hypothetical protein WC263_01730 [Candidatus Micrarchaeia archaeon]
MSTSHTKNERAGAEGGREASTAAPMSRAQAAVEMLAYAAFFFAVFVTAVAVFLQVQNQELTRAENAYAQEIAYGFADSIHSAFVAGPGFTESISVPRDILGKRYWLLLSRSSDASVQETGIAYVNWETFGKNASFSAPTVTSDYGLVDEGQGGFVTASGNFIIIDAAQGKAINISNAGGMIKIEKG